jgi:hypothetical protein
MKIIAQPAHTVLDALLGFLLFGTISALLRRDKSNVRIYAAFVLAYAAPIAFFFIAWMTLRYDGENKDEIRRVFFIAGLFGYLLTTLFTVILWMTLRRWQISLYTSAALALILTLWFYFSILF